jgi:mono/diheme cytochrome c family protein
MRRWGMAAAALMVAVGASGALAQPRSGFGDPSTGQAFALQTCAVCHLVSRWQLAPKRFDIAPSFAAIANLPSTTPSALRAFLSSPHPTMPNLILSRREQRNVIAYIMSLKR